jgi:hypothetical protein
MSFYSKGLNRIYCLNFIKSGAQARATAAEAGLYANRQILQQPLLNRHGTITAEGRCGARRRRPAISHGLTVVVVDVRTSEKKH